jgi:hypothetical protein
MFEHVQKFRHDGSWKAITNMYTVFHIYTHKAFFDGIMAIQGSFTNYFYKRKGVSSQKMSTGCPEANIYVSTRSERQKYAS